MICYNSTIDSDDEINTSLIDISSNEILIPASSNALHNGTVEECNIMDGIVQHQFMEHLELQKNLLYASREMIYIIPYRIVKHSISDTIEYYIEYNIPGDFLSTSMIDTSVCIDTVVNEILKNMMGRKKIVGNLKYNDNQYLFVQVRNNNGLNERWITTWDILANKHYFGENIQENVVDFFIHHSTISDLILHKRVCSKPITLYSNVDESYLSYIIENQCIQYCQRERGPIIVLNTWNNNHNNINNNDSNIKIVCFVDERNFSTSEYNLINRDSIRINRNGHIYWIFKNEIEIVSYSTKK
jgi:hypothetical protein